MIKAPISLQVLRRSLYVKAKAEPTWRFWGLYVHICKMETLRAAYALAKANDGAPGIDGVTFEAIEASGVEGFLQQIQDELVAYGPVQSEANLALLHLDLGGAFTEGVDYPGEMCIGAIVVGPGLRPGLATAELVRQLLHLPAEPPSPPRPAYRDPSGWRDSSDRSRAPVADRRT